MWDDLLAGFAILGYGTMALDLALWLNRRLSCVGWWFYRRSMAAAERKRAEREYIERSWQTHAASVMPTICPAQHALLPHAAHARVHQAAIVAHQQHVAHYQSLALLLDPPRSHFPTSAGLYQLIDPQHYPWTDKER